MEFWNGVKSWVHIWSRANILSGGEDLEHSCLGKRSIMSALLYKKIGEGWWSIFTWCVNGASTKAPYSLPVVMAFLWLNHAAVCDCGESGCNQWRTLQSWRRLLWLYRPACSPVYELGTCISSLFVLDVCILCVWVFYLHARFSLQASVCMLDY